MKPVQRRDEDLATHDSPERQALSPNLQSAFASNSNLRFSEDQGRPPLSDRRSIDKETGRALMDGTGGEASTQTNLERLKRLLNLQGTLHKQCCNMVALTKIL